MYGIVRTKDFERSFRKLKSSGKFGKKAQTDLVEVIDLLVRGNPLPAEYSDHALSGAFKGYRECHIKADLLLVYKREIDKLVLVLVDLGSHSDIFG